MSTAYVSLKAIRFESLFDGTLKRFGIREHVTGDSSRVTRLLTDGQNSLWVTADEAGCVAGFKRYLPNGAPGLILAAIEEVFDTDIVSEYEPEFWGFKTQEEWDAAETRLSEKHDAAFYLEVMKYVRGQRNNLRPGTNGMIWAERAKLLIAENPDLGLADRSAELFKAIKQVDPKHRITLSDLDVVLCKALLGEDDDVPSA